MRRERAHGSQRPLPLWLKVSFTAFVAVLVPVYWDAYGPQNFLWFSDIALFAIVLTLWLEHPLPASMGALGVLALELIWTLDFLVLIAAGTAPMGLAEYMVDDGIPLGVRAISLFHLVLPPLLFWLVYRLSYDRRAFKAQTMLALVVLPVTYLLTDPSVNINWVFGPGGAPQQTLPPLAYLGLLMTFLPLAVYLPTHLLFTRVLPRVSRGFRLQAEDSRLTSERSIDAGYDEAVTASILHRIPVVGGLGYVERVRRLPPRFTAALQPERGNRYFPQAVAVLVEGEKVGYLAPEIGRRYHEPLSGWAGEPPTCPGRCASVSDHQGSGVELLLDFSSLPSAPAE